MITILLQTIINMLQGWIESFNSHAQHMEDKIDSIDSTASDIKTDADNLPDIKDNTAAVITPIQSIKANTDSISTSSSTTASNTTAILNNIGTLSTNTGKAAAFAEDCANNTLDIKDKVTTIASDTTQIRADSTNAVNDLDDIKSLLREFAGVMTTTEDVSGNICNFDTDLRDEVEAASFVFKATQSGTPTLSDPKPITGVTQTVVHKTGKNLLDNQLTTQTINGTTVTVNSDLSITVSGTPSSQARFTINSGDFIVRDICKFSCGTIPNGIRFFCLRNSGGTVSYPTMTNGYNLSTVGDIFNNIRLEVNTTYDGTPVTLYPMIEIGTVSTDYEKFKKVDTIISLGDTYYGGKAVKTSEGDFKVLATYRIRTFSWGMLDGFWSESSWGVGTVYSRTLSDSKTNGLQTLTGALSDIYTEVTPGYMYTHNEAGFCINGNLIRVMDPSFNSFADWKDAVKDYHYIYELNTPLEFTMDPFSIQTYKGINNIWTDNGASEITYKETLQHKIDKQ